MDTNSEQQETRPMCAACGKRPVERRWHPTAPRWRSKCRQCNRPAQVALQADPTTPRPVCKECGLRFAERRSNKDTTRGMYKSKCWICGGKDKRIAERLDWWRPYQWVKDGVRSCSRCGFVSECSCQLDVDHIDGDHANNDPSNLQVLCANCHRLKTHREHQLKTRVNDAGVL